MVSRDHGDPSPRPMPVFGNPGVMQVKTTAMVAVSSGSPSLSSSTPKANGRAGWQAKSY